MSDAPVFDTKIAVVLRDDLAVWQKTNVTAFLVSGIAGTEPGVVGEPYRDASGNQYLPMFVQPVLVYEANRAGLRRAYERVPETQDERGWALSAGLAFAELTKDEPPWDFGDDEADTPSIQQVEAATQSLLGMVHKLAERDQRGR